MYPTRKCKRHYISSIKTKQEYHDFINKFMLCEEEKLILDMIFIESNNYCYIADFLGYSEQTIINKVAKILDKLEIDEK